MFAASKGADMTTIEGKAGLANRIRPVVQVLGGRFMTSPELAAVEAEVGLPPRSLYVRGRSAVLGDVPPKVAAELFGIFPHWLFDFVLPPAGRTPTAQRPASNASVSR
jgi:helix-turn-helix protein